MPPVVVFRVMRTSGKISPIRLLGSSSSSSPSSRSEWRCRSCCCCPFVFVLATEIPVSNAVADANGSKVGLMLPLIFRDDSSVTGEDDDDDDAEEAEER